MSVALVALLTEGVGRNRSLSKFCLLGDVALLTEGVGRNKGSGKYADDVFVALLAEGVGRNRYRTTGKLLLGGRPPRGGRG